MPNFGLGDALLDQLKGVGVVVPDDFAALIIIEAYSDALGDSRAAESLSRMREKMRETPAGLALDRVAFGARQSIRKDAQAVGTSASTLWRHEKQVRETLPLQWQAMVKTDF